MRKQARGLVLAMLLGFPLVAQAEPISFEQAANVTGLTGIQVGFEYEYAYSEFEREGLDPIETKLTQVPIFVRVGLPILEIKLSTPYGDLQNNIDSAVSKDFSGIKHIGLGLKTPLLPLPIFTVAAGLNTNFPTAEPEYYIFGEGLKLEPFLAADMDLMLLKLHANVSFEYRGDYEFKFDPDSPVEVKLDPGDAFKFGLGAELPLGDIFNLHLELIGTQYGSVKFDGSELPDSEFRSMSIVPGVRAQVGPFKAKFGVVIPVSEDVGNGSFGYAPSADWKIITGASLLFGL